MIIDLRGFGALAPGAGQPVIVSEPTYTFTPTPPPPPPAQVFIPSGNTQLTADAQAGISRSLGVPPNIGDWKFNPIALVAGGAFEIDFVPRWKQANDVAGWALDLAKLQPDPEVGRLAVGANDALQGEMNILAPVLEALAKTWDSYATAVAEGSPIDHVNNIRNGLIWWADRATEHLGMFIIQGSAKVRIINDQVYAVLNARAAAVKAAEEAARAQAEADAVIAKAEAEAAAEAEAEEARLIAEAYVQGQVQAQAERVQAIVEAASAAGADPEALQEVVQKTEEAIAQGVPPEAALAQAIATPPSAGLSPTVKIAGLTVGGLVLLKFLLK